MNFFLMQVIGIPLPTLTCSTNRGILKVAIKQSSSIIFKLSHYPKTAIPQLTTTEPGRLERAFHHFEAEN